MESGLIPSHLVDWLSLELSQLPFHQQNTILCPANYRFANSMILSSLNNDYFAGQKPIAFEIKDYMLKQMGFHLNLEKCRDLGDEQLTILTVYICLHSEHKNAYITRIISQLNEEDQQRIMDDIQILQEKLQTLKEAQHFWKAISDIEEENTKIVQQYKHLQEKYRICEMEKFQAIHERDQIILEKRKILSKFRLSNMAEYEQLCEQLTIENEENNANFRQIQKIIIKINEQKHQFEEMVKQRQSLICQLTNELNQLKQNYNRCLMQLQEYQNNLNQSFSIYCTKVCNSLGSTVDQTIQDTLQDAKNLQNFGNSDGFCASSSGFSFSKTNFSRNSTHDIFRMTKNNLTLCEKVYNFEQENEQLKNRIYQMEDQIKELEMKDRDKLNKLRKVQRLFDPFWSKCQNMQKQNHPTSGFQL